MKSQISKIKLKFYVKKDFNIGIFNNDCENNEKFLNISSAPYYS